MFALLASPLAKMAAGAIAVAVIVGGFFAWLAMHDYALRAAWVTEQRIAVADAVAAQRVIGDAATVAAATAAREMALADAPIREVIRRVTVQSACVANPGIGAALARVRATGAGPGSR